ncbi:ectoine synthase [Thermoproteota archaeon]
MVFIRTIEDIKGTKRDVRWLHGYSRRLLVKEDGQPFSFNVSTAKKSEFDICYPDHDEINFVLEGSCIFTIDGKEHQGKPGTLFILEKGKKMNMKILEDVKMICIFNPPLEDTEVPADIDGH